MLQEGISKINNKYKIDMTNDSYDDIINTSNFDIYVSKFEDNIYYFGYKFKPNISRKERTDFIHWLKSINLYDINPQIESFILKPLIQIDKRLQLNNFNLFLSPKSNRSELVHIIKYIFNRYLQRNTQKLNFEIVKNIPNAIEFDWDSFYSDNEDKNEYSLHQIENYINNTLLPKIHNLSYFSLAENVPTKYRPYITKYLMMDEKTKKFISNIHDGKILIMDDINTTGSTLSEIIRLIKTINKNCEIYIFTLIGK